MDIFLCPTLASYLRPSLSSQQKSKEAEVFCCVPASWQRQKLLCKLLALVEKISTREPTASRGGQCYTVCPHGTLHAHCQAAQTDSLHGNAKRRKDALSPGKAQPCPSLQPNCPGALASRPKQGDPLAEPHIWEEDACASIRDRAAFV